MPQIRINELCRELEVKSTRVLELLRTIGVGKKSHSSLVDDFVANRVRAHFRALTSSGQLSARRGRAGGQSTNTPPANILVPPYRTRGSPAKRESHRVPNLVLPKPSQTKKQQSGLRVRIEELAVHASGKASPLIRFRSGTVRQQHSPTRPKPPRRRKKRIGRTRKPKRAKLNLWQRMMSSSNVGVRFVQGGLPR